MKTHQEQIIRKLSKIRTSNQWSFLNVVVDKLNKTIGPSIKQQDLAVILQNTELMQLKQQGIWVQSFGSKYAPIICINPAFPKYNQINELQKTCKCDTTISKATFSDSLNYNVGKHQSAQSNHLATCFKWQPPKAGHLHSWRRSYNK